MTYAIGEFSKIVGLSIDTLRYYEKEGLIYPQRTANNLRAYTDHDIQWINFIKRLKLTGMPIRNIKTYATLRYQGNTTIDERLILLNDQKSRLAAEQTKLQAHIDFLDQKINTYHQMKWDLLLGDNQD